MLTDRERDFLAAFIHEATTSPQGATRATIAVTSTTRTCPIY